MLILALDPGTTHSGLVSVRNGTIETHEVSENATILGLLSSARFAQPHPSCLAIEMFEPRGMPLGRESLETVLWTGRFIQAWSPRPYCRVHRSAIKLHLCGSNKAKDGNIRQALLDRWGPQGKKANPGVTYGIKSHEWAALAVATYYLDTQAKGGTA
jgi:hypothetical protein